MTQRRLPPHTAAAAYRSACAKSPGFQRRQTSDDLGRGHPVGHRGHRDPQPANIGLAGRLLRLDGDAIENHTLTVETDRYARPLRFPSGAQRRRPRNVQSGAVGGRTAGKVGPGTDRNSVRLIWDGEKSRLPGSRRTTRPTVVGATVRGTDLGRRHHGLAPR